MTGKDRPYLPYHTVAVVSGQTDEALNLSPISGLRWWEQAEGLGWSRCVKKYPLWRCFDLESPKECLKAVETGQLIMRYVIFH